MIFQHLGELGFVQSCKPGGVFEGMFRGHDHQKEEIAGTDLLQTKTDSDMTCDPSLQRTRLHRVTPLYRLEIDRVE